MLLEFPPRLFADGDELAISASKGGVTIPSDTFVVGSSGSTLGDLARHMEAVFGINTDPATGGKYSRKSTQRGRPTWGISSNAPYCSTT